MGWTSLQAGAFGADPAHTDVDANLVWADATGFTDFGAAHLGQPKHIPVLVELNADDGGPDPLQELEKELAQWSAGHVVKAYLKHPGVRYCTALFNARYCKAVLGGRRGRMIRRFELQLPVVPQRPRAVAPVSAPGDGARRARSKTSTLIGVIDSGCPFAHQLLRDQKGNGTRLLNVWDQNARAPAFASCGGAVPADFGYGCEIPRKGLNDIMAACTVAGTRTIDEDVCYQMSGDPLLRERFQHGAAVLGLLVAPHTLGARLEVNSCVPPTWALADDEASKADIVFVQLPREVVQDSSSAALSRHVLDGLRYILSCARDDTQHIVVNLSDSTARGTHDGESVMEQALVDLVEERHEKGGELSIVLSAGNSYSEARHVQFDKLVPDVPSSAVMRLPPGNEAPSYAFVRVPTGVATVELRLTPPGRPRDASPWVQAGHAVGLDSASAASVGLVFPKVSPGAASVAMLAFAPTSVSGLGQNSASAGEWLIEARSSEPLNQPVHVYIARNQRNSGALPRGLQPRFVDVDSRYDPDSALRNAEDDISGGKSFMRRLGSLSGLATGAPDRGIYCIAGYRLRDRRPTLYSAAGPAPGGSREGPDVAALSDESRALMGVRTAGGRSGQTVRAAGTSFSAPQAARALVNGALDPCPEHAPPDPADPRRSGRGNLAP